jgi:hypothetical protein
MNAKREEESVQRPHNVTHQVLFENRERTKGGLKKGVNLFKVHKHL